MRQTDISVSGRPRPYITDVSANSEGVYIRLDSDSSPEFWCELHLGVEYLEALRGRVKEAQERTEEPS